MAISIYPITENFAAEVGDVDLSQPLTAEDASAIKEAFWKYAVLVFPDQHLSADQHVAFSREFGPLEGENPTIASYRKGDAGEKPGHSELADVSNLDQKNEVWSSGSRARMFHLGNQLWHTDSSFHHVPARASLLYAREIAPIGGHTEFADERAAYDALSETNRRRLERCIVEHSIFHSRARIGYTEFPEAERQALPPALQVLVRTIPESGRQSLYLAAHAARILDMPDAEGQALLEELIEHATQRQFVYTHRWRQHDLVMWDNRCTMHRGREFDDLRWKRNLKRATVSDTANSVELAKEQAARSGESCV